MDEQDKMQEQSPTERPTAETILAAAGRAIARRGVEATRIAEEIEAVLHREHRTAQGEYERPHQIERDEDVDRVADALRGIVGENLERLEKNLTQPAPGPTTST